MKLPLCRQTAFDGSRYIVKIIWFVWAICSGVPEWEWIKEMSNITGEGDRDWIGLCLNTDARESRCRKIHLCNLGWKKIQRWGGREEGAKRRGAGRLSNYPFKPNLRCCLKLTYANEVAKSHWGSRWLRLYRSKIGFHILSQYYQMQIRKCGKMFMQRTEEQFSMPCEDVTLLVAILVFTYV